jgi:hypothetical protein
MMTREMQLALNRYKVSQDSPDDFKIGLKLLRAGMVAYNVLAEKELETMSKRKGKDGNPLVMDDEIEYYITKGWITDFRTEHQVKKDLETKQSEIEVITKLLNDVAPQFLHLQSPKAQHHWLRIAKEHPELEASQQIIAQETAILPLENPARGETTTTTTTELS